MSQAKVPLLLDDPRIMRARDLLRTLSPARRTIAWPSCVGLVTEIIGEARASFGAQIAWSAQHASELVAWITVGIDPVYPPDLAAGGLDLEAMAMLAFAQAQHAGVAADKLLRSGAFGLVVLDVDAQARLEQPLLGRMVRLCRVHDAAVLVLRDAEASQPSMGPMVARRLHAQRRRSAEGQFRLSLEALKDKHHGPGWSQEVDDAFAGPPGLR